MENEKQSILDRLLETDRVPEWLIRVGVRRLLGQRLAQENAGDLEAQNVRLMGFIRALRYNPIAICTGDANQQHYEVPTVFFKHVLH